MRELTGFVIPETLASGARALRAVLWENFVDREVYGILRVMFVDPPRLARYICLLPYRDGLLKVAKERRNLLPLLRLIKPQSWTHDALFSKNLWCRQGRPYTALDGHPFKLCSYPSTDLGLISVQHPISFRDVRDWNWLRQASPLVVREWVKNGADPQIITLLSQIGNIRAPVIAWMHLLRHQDRFLDSHPQLMIRFLRLFIRECARIWRDEGFSAAKNWIKDSRLSLLDYLDWLTREGFAAGQPTNNATWASIGRHSDDWHRRVAIEYIEESMAQENRQWQSLITDTVINGITFTALNDARALAIEGYEQKHCIGHYASECAAGMYRAYRVTEKNGTRSTLGFYIEDDTAIHDQHRGKYNGKVSRAAEAAGQKLVKRYSKALRDSKDIYD